MFESCAAVISLEGSAVIHFMVILLLNLIITRGASGIVTKKILILIDFLLFMVYISFKPNDGSDTFTVFLQVVHNLFCFLFFYFRL